MDIPLMIKNFHNSLCNDRNPKEFNQRQSLLNRWQRFIDSVPSEGREVATKAMQVDMVARTVLYESHPTGVLSSRHKNQGECEWDIITLSIRNRAVTCKKKKYFHCRFPEDYVGVATAPSQYHIWRLNNVNNTYITSCFLRDDLQDGVYPNLSPKASADYNVRRKAFKKILKKVPIVMGLYRKEKDRMEGDYLGNLFQVTRVGDNEIAKDDGVEPLKHLKHYHHYYHPGGLGGCFVEKYPYTQYIKSAYISMRQDHLTDFGLLIRARILRETMNEQGYWSFSIKDVNNRKVHYLLSTDYFYGEPLVSEGDFKNLNTSYTCLPQGRLPPCYSEKEKSLAYGKRVPNQWFTTSMKSKVRKFLVDERGLDMPKGWDEVPSSGGLAVGIKCLSKDLESEKKFPEFHGMCDRNFMPVTGVQ